VNQARGSADILYAVPGRIEPHTTLIIVAVIGTRVTSQPEGR